MRYVDHPSTVQANLEPISRAAFLAVAENLALRHVSGICRMLRDGAGSGKAAEAKWWRRPEQINVLELRAVLDTRRILAMVTRKEKAEILEYLRKRAAKMV